MVTGRGQGGPQWRLKLYIGVSIEKVLNFLKILLKTNKFVTCVEGSLDSLDKILF